MLGAIDRGNKYVNLNQIKQALTSESSMNSAINTDAIVRDIRASSFLDNNELNDRMKSTHIDVISLNNLSRQIKQSDALNAVDK